MFEPIDKKWRDRHMAVWIIILCLVWIGALLLGYTLGKRDEASRWLNLCNPQQNERLSYTVQREGFGLICVYHRAYGLASRKEYR